jgi:hypothetical protein
MYSLVNLELEEIIMTYYLVINKLLYILEKLPYRTKFGLSLADVIKVRYYHKYGKNKRPERCICGGIVTTIGVGREGWETACRDCEFLYDED